MLNHRQTAFRFLMGQAIVGLWLSSLFFYFQNVNAFRAAAYGALICLLPNTLFAVKLFRNSGAGEAQQIVTSFYTGEAGKLVLTGILFWVAFKFLSAQPLPLMITFIFTQFSLVVMPMMKSLLATKKTKAKE